MQATSSTVQIKVTLEVLSASGAEWVKQGEEIQAARVTAKSYILEGGEGRKVTLPRFSPRSSIPKSFWSSFCRTSHHTYELVTA